MENGGVSAKLDRILGQLTAVGAQQTAAAAEMRGLSDRMVRVEEGVTATKDVVEAWGAAKTSLRFLKWFATLVAAVAAVAAALKGWVHR